MVENEIESLREEDYAQFEFQNEEFPETTITNGEQNFTRNSIQNPDKVKQKGRPKKRKRFPTIVEAAKEKARKKRSIAAAKRNQQGRYKKGGKQQKVIQNVYFSI